MVNEREKNGIVLTRQQGEDRVVIHSSGGKGLLQIKLLLQRKVLT